MKINSTKIKNWSPSKRLAEMQYRLELLAENVDRDDGDGETPIRELLLIVKVWKKELGTEDKKPVEKKEPKPVNLWP